MIWFGETGSGVIVESEVGECALLELPLQRFGAPILAEVVLKSRAF